jgi:hypothetical protein
MKYSLKTGILLLLIQLSLTSDIVYETPTIVKHNSVSFQ